MRPFTDRQVELVESFAHQAVIAIENTRLLNELREALQQQTATADVLRVISSSPGQLGPVFQEMLENATRICEASLGSMALREGDGFRRVALYNPPPEFAKFNEREPYIAPGGSSTLDRLMRTKQLVHLPVEDPTPRLPSTQARAPSLLCRCSRRMSWSVPLASIAGKSDHSLTSRSSWCRTSPPRP